MKEKVKNAVNKSVNWIKEHKAKIIAGATGVGLTVLGVKAIKSIKSNNSDDLYLDEPVDYGRNCVMKFIVDDESHEVLGEVPCTESYAKDLLEISDYSNEK